MNYFQKVLTLFLAVLIVLLIPLTAIAAEKPKVTEYVSDFAKQLSNSESAKLNQDLINFQKAKDIKVNIITVKSLDGKDIESYINEIYRSWNWGITKINHEKTIFFVVVTDDKLAKIFVANYEFSTGELNRILASTSESFENGNTSKGIIDGTNGILRSVENRSNQNNSTNTAIIITIVAASLFSFIVNRYMTKK